MLSADESRRELLRHFAGLTFHKVFAGAFPSMATLRQKYTVDELERVLAILILDCSRAFGDSLSPDDGLELATEVQTMYYYLSLEDCYLVLQKLKRKKLYGKFCLNTVLQAFDEYDQERYTKADEINYNKHLSNKNNSAALKIEASEGISPEGQKVLDNLSKLLKKKKDEKGTVRN